MYSIFTSTCSGRWSHRAETLRLELPGLTAGLSVPRVRDETRSIAPALLGTVPSQVRSIVGGPR